MTEKQTQQIQDNNFLVWDKLFSKLAWKFQQTKSGDMFIDSEVVYNELKNEFDLTLKSNPMKIKKEDVLEFDPQGIYSAKKGAKAVFTGQYYIDRGGGELIEVKWIRDGNDNGQNDGGYYLSMFTKIESSN